MMENLFDSKLYEHLDRLAGHFVWRRKPLRDAIVAQLKEAQARHENTEHARQNAEQELHRAREAYKKLSATQAATQRQLEEAESRCERVTKSRDDLRDQLAGLDKRYTQLEDEHGKQKALTQLISQLFFARPHENKGLAAFQKLLDEDYMAFAKEGSSLVVEADALQELQSIYRELQDLIHSSNITERAIVGVAGSFSSGKSAFINSFIESKETRLKVGLEPVTAFPAYVTASEKTAKKPEIYAITTNGGQAELDISQLEYLTSRWIDVFDFDARALIRSLHVEVEMKPDFQHLCFLDTPGYSAAETSGQHTAKDRATALAAIRIVDSVIWIISVENGTVPKSDLEFIREAELGTSSRPVYVVLNKADLRPEDDLERIIATVNDTLEDEGIVCLGISAYSAGKHKEYAYANPGETLENYLTSLKLKKNGQYDHFKDRITSVFARYDQAINEDQGYEQAIRNLEFEILRADGGAEMFKALEKHIQKLKIHTPDALKKAARETRKLRERFLEAVEQAIN